MTSHSAIVVIESIAALLFLTATILSFKVFLRTKKTTDIWLLISFAALVAFAASGLNAFEWLLARPVELDKIGEYTTIVFSIVWIYIAYRFISVRKIEGKS